MEKMRDMIPKKRIIFVILCIIFWTCGYDFIMMKGYESPVATILFKMVVVLGIMMWISNLKKLKKMMHHTYLEDYFKKK